MAIKLKRPRPFLKDAQSRHRQDSSSAYRLDAAESVFFRRELEVIDQRVYEVKYPALLARELIPTLPGIPDWARTYTWREYDKFGKAKIIANMSDDLPRADAKGTEFSKVMKTLGMAYGYDIDEIKASAKTGTRLDQMRANACRFAIELEIDEILAVGNTAHNLEGLLTIASGTTAFTPMTKAAGGLTWGTVAAPNATGMEVAADIMGICARLVEVTKGIWSRFVVLLPIEQYNYAAMTRISSVSDTTALAFAKANCPFLEDLKAWHRCDTAGGGGTDRMVAYPRDPMVIGGIVPQEYTPLPVERRNLEYIINTTAKCGGTVCKYPVSVAYGDGI